MYEQQQGHYAEIKFLAKKKTLQYNSVYLQIHCVIKSIVFYFPCFGHFGTIGKFQYGMITYILRS
jgi:hypothetical protein